MKKLEMDENMLNQEEEFFNKWLKQRENLGGEKLDNSASQRNASQPKAPGSVKKSKDKTQADLDKLEAQLKKDRLMKNYNVDKRTVKKTLDVNSISAATIEAFIGYLDITE